MAYTPTEWKKGDKVTSAKLNKIEQGISATSGLITATFDEQTGVVTLDKSYNDIEAMFSNGVTPIFVMESETGVNVMVCGGLNDSVNYQADFIFLMDAGNPEAALEFTAETADAPLTLNLGGGGDDTLNPEPHDES